MGKIYTYDELKKFVDSCHGCSLGRTRDKAVMGRGDIRSRLMFVAEAPGNNEDHDGIPFTGKSGVILDRWLESIGLTRGDVYITNIVKCHPPGNRDPRPEEKERCIEYLRYETALIRPEIIVCLGRVAAQRLIRENFRITKEHGTFTEKKGILFTAVYHPSAVLRDPGKENETLEDFRRIKERLEKGI